MTTLPLVILETHPVQYHAPVYKAVAAAGVPVSVVYGSDFSVVGYKDREFGQSFAWDTNLLSGYESRFLSRVAEGGAASYDAVRPNGLETTLAELAPSAVMVLGYSSRFDRAAVRASVRRGRPVLFRGETTDHARERPLWKRLLRDAWLRRFYRRCARLLYVGQRSREHFHRLGVPDGRLAFSPYCVDTSAFCTTEADRGELRSSTRAELGLTDDRIAVLFSGKLVPRKGVNLLPDSARRLPSGVRSRVTLLFLGEGELRSQLTADAACEPAVDTRFLGFRNQTSLSRFYHAADLLVLPSRESETWGLVVNEALHHGVPVVASDAVGSVPDLVCVGRTGEVCAAGDAVALADAITRALPLVGRREVRDACRRTAFTYSVTAAAAGIVSAFRAVTS